MRQVGQITGKFPQINIEGKTFSYDIQLLFNLTQQNKFFKIN